jgi:hypothetical protein
MYGIPLDRFTIHGLTLGLELAICCILLGVGGPVGGRPPEARRRIMKPVQLQTNSNLVPVIALKALSLLLDLTLVTVVGVSLICVRFGQVYSASLRALE